jgi:hypothetical protein
MRAKRGVRAGCPDNWIVDRGRLICIEMKNPVGGRCSRVQLEVRVALLRSGIADWWEARSAAAAMVALKRSKVRFRVIARPDGSIERWTPPVLRDWEVPRRDPCERRAQHPAVREQRRAYARRRRERKRARALEAASEAAPA